MVGTSGRVPERVLLVTASARNFPSLMCGDATAGELKPIGVCSPDHRHHRRTGAAERNVGERIGSTLSLVSAGLGISCVPWSLQRMYMDGVVYRRRKGAAQPKALLSPASRRGDPSAVVRQFLGIVRKVATEFAQP